jgi:DNA-binding transcriptional ArsR family regulator
MPKNPAALDAIYHALAEPNRRVMLQQLSAKGGQSVSQLKATLPISLPAVMQHVDVLAKSGLIRTYKEGGARISELRVAGLDTAQRWIEARRAALNKRLDRLETYLESEDSTAREEDAE